MGRTSSSAAGRVVTRARLAVRLVSARVHARPFILSHLVTGRCNGRCPTCLWRDLESEELDTAACGHGSTARRAGPAWPSSSSGAASRSCATTCHGCCGAAKEAGLSTTLISNGWLAEERWPEVRGRVDALILSLDDVGAAHDRLRGLPGLSDRLEAFVEPLRRDPLRPTLLVNTVLSRLNAARWRGWRRWHSAGAQGSTSAPWRPATSPPPASSPGTGAGPPRRGAARGGAAGRRAQDQGLPHSQHAGLSRPSRSGPRPAHLHLPDAESPSDGRGGRGGARLPAHRPSPRPRARSARLREPVWRASSPCHGAASYWPMRPRCTKCNNPDVIELSWLWDLRPAMLRKVVELAIG